MQKKIQSAYALYSSGQITQALILLKTLVNDYPNEAILHNLSGACYASLGRLDDAVNSYKEALIIKQDYAEVHNSLGVSLQGLGLLSDAIKSYENSIAVSPDYAEAHNNLGNTFKELEQLESAINSYENAIAIKPNLAQAHYNLGLIFNELRDHAKAVRSYEKAIAINPNYQEAYNNLGGAFQMLSKMNLAVKCYKKAIEIDQSFLEAHINLGLLLTELGKLTEAESYLRKAITINPESSKAHNNLGNALKDLNKLEEAESSYRKAIDLKPDFANAYSNLGIIFYANGDLDSSLESLEKAYSLKPESKLLLTVVRARKARASLETNSEKNNQPENSRQLAPNPLILNREVEAELVNTLYEMKSIELDELRDPGYGNAKGSDIRNSLFEDNHTVIKSVEKDLVKMIKDAIKTDIYIEDSWFVILGAGGGLNSHDHITYLDRDSTLNLASQKYSFVYYLATGDKDCSEPGILKLYEPSEDILPYEGMIMIFPADRPHSVVYNGKKDRVIIGINFYSL